MAPNQRQPPGPPMTPEEQLRAKDYKRRFKLVARTQRWAITMTKVCIRQAISNASYPRWHFVSFVGPRGGESRGIVDLIAIRKNHTANDRFERGDRFQIILIQVKGGQAAAPTSHDAERLRAVARHHRAERVLWASWKKGTQAEFYSLRRTKPPPGQTVWAKISDLQQVFR